MYEYIPGTARKTYVQRYVMLDPLRHHRLVRSWATEGELVKRVRPVLVIRAPDGRRVLAIEREEIAPLGGNGTH